MKKQFNRRDFLKTTGAASAGIILGAPGIPEVHGQKQKNMPVTIDKVNSDFEREPLIRPFGFKGDYMTEIWQTAAQIQSDAGDSKIGLCTQNVLWSDAQVFTDFSESGGNSLMYAMSDRALQMVKGMKFDNPVQLLDEIFDEVYAYGKKITNNPDLRKTFVLNALVGVDNAAWLLYAAKNGIRNFDDMIPEQYKPALSHKHDTVASIPLMAYTIPVEEIKEAAEQGYFFMKIKIGQPGSQKEMLEKDKARLSAIHKAIGDMRTPHTKDGKLPYYFDANGRYESKETLKKLLDHAKKIGAFDQIAVIEEPFPENLDMHVDDLPVRIAADESLHSVKDASKRIQMGYSAFALKAIAKTMSMTMKQAQLAYENDVPCFMADLTVNPILVEWNKAVAARLAPLPGMGEMGLLETNGHQNYANWDTMVGYHPYPDASWRKTKDGVFHLNEDYYKKDGGIFKVSWHYKNMFKH
jgi:L-alanine-DL-glutamate epimerase-like enolase superfamily enzyme